MNNSFSKYLNKKKKTLKELIAILGQKYQYASVLGTDVVGTSIRVDRRTTTINPHNNTESGFVVKVYDGKTYFEYAINEIDNKNIDKVIQEINELVNSKISCEHVNVGLLQEDELVKNFSRKMRGKSFTNEEIVNILKEYVDDALKYNELILNANASLSYYTVSKIFISTKKELTQFYGWVNANIFALARRENNMKYAYEGFGNNNIEEALLKTKDLILSTAQLAVDLLDSETPIPGYYDVITDASITGLIAHEAFGHGVEMDMFVKDRAMAKEYIGKRVASPLVNMHDGAAATFSAASYFFDDDGVLAQDTQIIKDGILQTGISDALSALQLGTTPTGNGRRQSYKRKAYTRMTNTFFSKGKDKLEDMIKSIDHGYMLYTTNNGMEDPKNWGIQCTALYGKEIKDGKFTGKLVSPVVLSGNVIELLNSITAVSNTFNVIGSGSCGKGYKEWVNVSDGGPNLKAKVRIG